MKHARYLLIYMLPALMLASCSNGSSSSEPDGRVKVDIVGNIASTTKAPVYENGVGHFSAGDEYGLFAVVDNQTVINNLKYDANGATTLYWDQLSTKREVSFTAFYPYVKVDDPERYVFGVANKENADLLVAKPVVRRFAYPETPSVKLVFRHVMHKLVVNLKAGEGYTQEQLNKATVNVLNVVPATIVNLLTGEVLRSEGDKITLSKAGGAASREFILPSQSVTTGNGFIRIVLADVPEGNTDTYNFSVPEKVGGKAFTELESGKILTFNITVSKTGVSLETSIAPWESQGAVGGDIIPE